MMNESSINSTIAHEMRNPLNSIINQCTVQVENLRDLKNLVAMTEHHMDQYTRDRFNSCLHEVDQANIITGNSSKLLLFEVEDILGMG